MLVVIDDSKTQSRLSALTLVYLPEIAEHVLSLRYPHDEDQLHNLHKLTLIVKEALRELSDILGDE